jgi:hypothetical protein
MCILRFPGARCPPPTGPRRALRRTATSTSTSTQSVSTSSLSSYGAQNCRRRRQDSEDRRPREPSAENEITQRTADKRQNRNPGRRGTHRRNQNKHRARKAQSVRTQEQATRAQSEKEGQGRGWGENRPGHQAWRALSAPRARRCLINVPPPVLFDHVSCLFGDHYGGCVGVPRGDSRSDGTVNDSQPGYPMDL